eukprot:scaffold28774_cov34-Prasinocladus_malaysianus.AAC.1
MSSSSTLRWIPAGGRSRPKSQPGHALPGASGRAGPVNETHPWRLRCLQMPFRRTWWQNLGSGSAGGGCWARTRPGWPAWDCLLGSSS